MSALLPATTRQRDRALDVLLSSGLDPIVDMVGWTRAKGAYEVASADGAVQFCRDAGMAGGFRIESVTGQNPLAVQDQQRLVGLETERAVPHPTRRQNSYPCASLDRTFTEPASIPGLVTLSLVRPLHSAAPGCGA